jgi:hypothetical protein
VPDFNKNLRKLSAAIQFFYETNTWKKNLFTVQLYQDRRKYMEPKLISESSANNIQHFQ